MKLWVGAWARSTGRAARGLERSAAIKILPSGVARRIAGRESNERRALSPALTTRISACYMTSAARPASYIVMGLLEGESLAKRLERRALRIKETLRYGIEIAEALSAAHRRGVVHRDLKPGNIVLTKAGASVWFSPLTARGTRICISVPPRPAARRRS